MFLAVDDLVRSASKDAPRTAIEEQINIVSRMRHQGRFGLDLCIEKIPQRLPGGVAISLQRVNRVPQGCLVR